MFKKIWSWLKWVFFVVGWLVLGYSLKQIVREIATIGNPEKKKNWAVLNDKTIAVMDNTGNVEKVVKLPKDPENNKQINVDDIEAVGVSEGGRIDIKIKHNTIDRRGPVPGDG